MTTLTHPDDVNQAVSVCKAKSSRINFSLNAGYNNNVNYANGVLNTIIIKSLVEMSTSALRFISIFKFFNKNEHIR